MGEALLFHFGVAAQYADQQQVRAAFSIHKLHLGHWKAGKPLGLLIELPDQVEAIGDNVANLELLTEGIFIRRGRLGG